MWAILILSMALLFSRHAEAEESSKPKVVYDYVDRTLSDTLPHGKPFLLEVNAHASDSIEQAFVWKGTDCSKAPGENLASKRKIDRVEGKVRYTFEVRPLAFDTSYCVKVVALTPVAEIDSKIAERAFLAVLKYRVDHPGATDDALKGLLTRELGVLASKTAIPREKWAACHENVAQCPSQTVAEAMLRWFKGESGGEPIFVTAIEASHKLARYTDPQQDFQTELKQLDSLVAQAPGWSEPADSEVVTQLHELAKVGAAPLADEASEKLASLRTDISVRLGRLVEASKCLPAAAVSERHLSIQKELATLQSLPAEQQKKKQKEVSDKQLELKAATRCLHLREMETLLEHLRLPIETLPKLQANLDEAKLTIAGVLPGEISGFPLVVTEDSATELPSYTERAPFYVSADVGLMMPVFRKQGTDIALYVGVNLYFEAVDKNVPLSVDGGIGKRFSLMGGITLDKISDPPKSIEGVIGDQFLMGGVGFRLTDYLRLGGGVVFFDQRDPNPTVSQTSLRVAPYFALSLDSDVIGIVKDAIGSGKSKVQ
jgi:hypothetical protein